MARRVKCRVTGQIGDSSCFYRAPNGYYYKSEELYLEMVQKETVRKNLIRYISLEFLELTEGMKIPGFLLKKIKEYETPYGYSLLLSYLKENHELISRSLARISFSNDVRKIQYLFAIVDGNINTYYKKEKERLAKIEKAKETKVDMPSIEISPVKHKEKDIRGWLDDDT